MSLPRRIALFLCLFSAAWIRLEASQSITLAWEPNTEPNVAGYHVFYGTSADQYSQLLNVPGATTAIVSNLMEGNTYYFVVTAYDSAGIESLFSNQISYAVSGVPSPTPSPTPIQSPTPTPDPSPTPVPTPVPLPTATPTPLPTATPVNSSASLTVAATSLAVGAVEQVTLTGGWGNVNDTIVLTTVGGGVPIDWCYLNGQKTPPQWSIASSTVSFTMPTTGRFEFRYYSGSQIFAVSPQVDVSGSALPTPPPGITEKNLSNVSTRAYVQSGDNVVIGGFIIVGDYPKKVIIRALGPSLGAAGITNTLSNPTLTLYSSTGAAIGSNDDWRTSGDASTIAALGLSPSDDRESAIMATLAPGAYTAIIAGVNGAKGIALLEVNDAELIGSRIGNISTRSKVETGNNIMIGGFIINGSQSTQVLVRAIGPTLASNGVTGALNDPTLDLYNGNGSKIFSNDNWKTSSQKTQIQATGLAPSDDRESAILATLTPGNYTAMVHGAKNATGVALVEVYSVGN